GKCQSCNLDSGDIVTVGIGDEYATLSGISQNTDALGSHCAYTVIAETACADHRGLDERGSRNTEECRGICLRIIIVGDDIMWRCRGQNGAGAEQYAHGQHGC